MVDTFRYFCLLGRVSRAHPSQADRSHPVVVDHPTQWGRTKLPWLGGFPQLDYRVASPGTLERVLALLNTKQLEQAFRTWIGGLIRLDTSIKTSIETKRLLAATSEEFVPHCWASKHLTRMTMNDECVAAGALAPFQH